MENNNKYLISTLFASISVTFKPLIRPVISTIHICSQIVAVHKLDSQFTICPSLFIIYEVPTLSSSVFVIIITSATAHTALSASPLNPNVRNASRSDEIRDIRICFISMTKL
ncbi:hypothetical protein ALC56_08140 [Trachymyrmex septentrionalis]|uniref:Uncharacterized protein n=1 Tax=Trachymyrmex septentrionalis TaxID=34720 RepID=A0A151JVD1_9HYME|nr:hypothetical protein ALC56_08140 [Trachymyrmex septentrionalis]